VIEAAAVAIPTGQADTTPCRRSVSVITTDDEDAQDIYRLLETEILPRYRDPDRWAELMRSTIALIASFFNAQRMLHEYVMRAYLDDELL
jgi:glucan phosphorylase